MLWLSRGGIPVVCPSEPFLHHTAAWKTFTRVWESSCYEVLTATKNPLKTHLFLPTTLGVQVTSLSMEQGGKTKGESVISLPAALAKAG